jgi:hypothetical protein
MFKKIVWLIVIFSSYKISNEVFFNLFHKPGEGVVLWKAYLPAILAFIPPFLIGILAQKYFGFDWITLLKRINILKKEDNKGAQNKKRKNELYVLITLSILLIAYIFLNSSKHVINNQNSVLNNTDITSSNKVIKECNLFWDGFKFKLGKIDDSNFSSFEIAYYEYTKVNFFIPKEMAIAFGVNDFDNKDGSLEKHPKFAQFLNKELFPFAPSLCSFSK